MSEKRPSECSHCAKPSTVHLTQIVGGEVKKLDLCADCPMAKAVEDAGSMDIVEKSNVPLLRPIGKGQACPKCGFTQESFKELGRLGCPSCYDAFATGLEPVFQKLHKGTTHKGKSPNKTIEPALREEIEALKRELQERVDSEDYEQAAILRDRIWELEGRCY